MHSRDIQTHILAHFNDIIIWPTLIFSYNTCNGNGVEHNHYALKLSFFVFTFVIAY